MSCRPTFSCTLRHSAPMKAKSFERRKLHFSRGRSPSRRRWFSFRSTSGLARSASLEAVARRREKIRPLPAVDRAEHRAERLHPVVARRLPQRPRGDALLVGIVHGEDFCVGLLVLLDQIPGLGIGAEAARIDAEHVDGRLALDDPFGELPARAAGGGDAEGMALVEPEILSPPAPGRRSATRPAYRRWRRCRPSSPRPRRRPARARSPSRYGARGGRGPRGRARIRCRPRARRHSRRARRPHRARAAGRPPPRACTRTNPIRAKPPSPAGPAPCAPRSRDAPR